METLAYLHHSTAFERPEEYEITFDWEQVNLLDSAAANKLSSKGAMYLLAATCGLGVAVASEEAKAVLYPGDVGPAVSTLQVNLLNAGYSVPGAVSDFYGPSTESAVRALQFDCGVSVDGIFGPSTESCLFGGPIGGGLLSFGDSGADVAAWQRELISVGYLGSGLDTGYFGSLTDSATRALQADCGIAVDGVVGPSTRACLGGGPIGGGTLFPGDSGADVTAMQISLIDRGYLASGLATGFYGTQTTAAVRALQFDCGVAVDGIFGPQTRACL